MHYSVESILLGSKLLRCRFIFRCVCPPPNYSLDSMKKLMRYNDFTRDPLSTQLNTCQ
jgi:hypothetical protein